MGKRKLNSNFCSSSESLTNKDSQTSQSACNSQLSSLCRLFSDKRFKCADSQDSENVVQTKFQVENYLDEPISQKSFDEYLLSDINCDELESVASPPISSISNKKSTTPTKSVCTEKSFVDYTIVFDSSHSSKSLKDYCNSEKEIILTSTEESPKAIYSDFEPENELEKESRKSIDYEHALKSLIPQDYNVPSSAKTNSAYNFGSNTFLNNSIPTVHSSFSNVKLKTGVAKSNERSVLGNFEDEQLNIQKDVTSRLNLYKNNTILEYLDVEDSSSVPSSTQSNKSFVFSISNENKNLNVTHSLTSSEAVSSRSNLNSSATYSFQTELGIKQWISSIDENKPNRIAPTIIDSSHNSNSSTVDDGNLSCNSVLQSPGRKSVDNKSDVSLVLLTSKNKDMNLFQNENFENANDFVLNASDEQNLSSISVYKTEPSMPVIMSDDQKIQNIEIIPTDENYVIDLKQWLNQPGTDHIILNFAEDKSVANANDAVLNASNNQNMCETKLNVPVNKIIDQEIQNSASIAPDENYIIDLNQWLNPPESDENVILNAAEEQSLVPINEIVIENTFNNDNDIDFSLTYNGNTNSLVYDTFPFFLNKSEADNENFDTTSRSFNSAEVLSTGSAESFNELQKRLRARMNCVSKIKSLRYKGPITSYESEIDNKSRDIKNKILHIFFKIMVQAVNNQPILLVVRSKGNWSNCIFENNILQMKKRRDVKYSLIKPGVGTKFNVIMYLLGKMYAMIGSNMVYTQREVYYLIKKYLNNQNAINSNINVISCMLNIEPWYFPIVPTSKGSVYGYLTIVTTDGDVINCTASGGITIPQNTIKISQVITKASFIIVVEKDAVFKKMILEDVPNKYTRSFIIITGKGSPDITTRLFIRILRQHLKIPVFILVDADPSGIDIMLTYKYGSLSMSHLNRHLAEPGMQWLGILPSEIISLGIDYLPLGEKDQRQILAMLKRPYMSENSKIKEELNILLTNKFKAEIEGVEITNNYLTDFYLPNKFCINNF